jgi:hypothetical protein
MQSNPRDEIDDEPEREGVQEVLGELQEKSRPTRLPDGGPVEAHMRHTGQITRDVFRD